MTEKKPATLVGLSEYGGSKWRFKFTWKGVVYEKKGFKSRDAAKLHRDAQCRVLGDAAMQQYDVDPRKPILFR